jgi:hypothetical protein
VLKVVVDCLPSSKKKSFALCCGQTMFVLYSEGGIIINNSLPV